MRGLGLFFEETDMMMMSIFVPFAKKELVADVATRTMLEMTISITLVLVQNCNRHN